MSIFQSEDELVSRLVKKITEIQNAIESNKVIQKTKTSLQHHKCASTSQQDVNDKYKGIAEKLSIKGHQELSRAVEQYKAEFLQPSRPIGFHETNQSILKYDMLRLLLSLSSSLNQDYNYKPKLQRILQKKPLTWKEVVDNDPLEGDHWNQWPEDTSSDGNLSDYDEDQTQTQHQKKDTGMLDIEPLNYTNRMDMDTRSDQDGLRYLEKQQYWRDDFNLPKETLLEDTLLQNACQMSDTLMKLWQHQTGQDQKKTITEAGVIREVLSLLGGFGGILFVKEDDQFLLNEQYMVQHLSQHALSSILNEFNVYGNMLLKLRQQLMHSSPKDGQTMEAFVSVVHQLLAEFDGFLATLESNTSFITQDNTLVISLLQLRKQLSESLESLKAVYRIAADMPFEKTPKCIAIFLISILYERTMISHITGQESIYHTLLYVLQKTLVPYGHMMDDWVFFGSLMADRAREFYVTRNDAVSKHDSNFWLNGFVMESVAHEKCYPCPLFDERVMARVLFAGKAMNLLSHNQKSKGVHFEQVMHQFIPTKSFFIQPVSTQRQSEPVSSLVAAFFPLVTFNTPSREPDTIDNMNLLFDQSFLSCLETYIDIPYTEAAKALDVLLYEKCQLLDQMASLFSIYLMLENDLMHSFCEALFRQMDQKEFWLNPRLLNQTFANACETSGYDEIVYIGIRESAEGLVTQASSLELLEFKVEIPWPLNNFIQKNLIPSYSKILGFLLRLKRAKYVMEKKTFFNKRSTLEKSNVRAMKFYSLRMRILWFINAFWRYMMTTILHAETINFRDKLSISKDADEITALHNSLVQRIVDRCLLNDKAISIKKSIASIFDMAEQMKYLFEEHIQTNSEQDIDHTMNIIEKDFHRTNEFISISLMILGKKGNFPWFESLATTLFAQ